jgi:hypothetical protein
VPDAPGGLAVGEVGERLVITWRSHLRMVELMAADRRTLAAQRAIGRAARDSRGSSFAWQKLVE